MKLFKYCLLSTALVFCGCSDAATRDQAANLSCPNQLPSAKDLPSGWEVLGKIPTDKLQLRPAGIIYGNATAEKNRLSAAKERVFAEETIDDWEEVDGGYQAQTEYPEKHNENSLMCTYGRSEAESLDETRNVVLLIPIPTQKAVACVFNKRDVEPVVEASCKVK